MGHRKALASIVAALVLGAMLGCAGREARDAVVPEPEDRPPRIRLDLAWDGDPKDLNLIITLTNSGAAPVPMDRELVFLVDLYARTPEGRWVELEVVRELPRAAEAEIKERIVTLRPGDALKRRLELRTGFKCFWWRVNATDLYSVESAEVVCRIPANVEVYEVRGCYAPPTAHVPHVTVKLADGRYYGYSQEPDRSLGYGLPSELSDYRLATERTLYVREMVRDDSGQTSEALSLARRLASDPVYWSWRPVAILQRLRQIGEAQPLDLEAVKELLLYLPRSCPESDHLTVEAIALGAPGSDELVMARLKDVLGSDDLRALLPDFFAALGLARYPSRIVTDELVELAQRKEQAPMEFRLCAMALAARPGTRDEWQKRLSAVVLPLEKGEVGDLDYEAFMPALFNCSPAFDADGPVADALWHGLTALAEGRGTLCGDREAALALVACSRMKGNSGTNERSRLMLEMLKHPTDIIIEVALHVALAKADAAEGRHVLEALRLVGSERWGWEGLDWPVLLQIVDAIRGTDLGAKVGTGLTHPDREVQLGAVRVAARLGPDAQQMLPDVERLTRARDPEVAEAASWACPMIAGVDAKGEWVSPIGDVPGSVH